MRQLFVDNIKKYFLIVMIITIAVESAWFLVAVPELEKMPYIFIKSGEYEIDNTKFYEVTVPSFLALLIFESAAIIIIWNDYSSKRKILEKKDQIEILGELSAKISHDLRNPMSVILITLEGMKFKEQISPEAKASLDKINRAIFRMVHQIEGVFNFIKIQHAELNKVNMSELFNESKNSLNISNNVELILPKNNIQILCDKRQLSIALNNLILNGIQAIEGTGTIEITVEEDNNSITIQIKDSGNGISKKDMDKIFEPLFTTKQQGTGLGLSSVKSIIDAHGGIISVNSPPTIFTITLPKINS